jgi:ParB family chromosome partitioning protein
MVKSRGLGRGLDALLAVEEKTQDKVSQETLLLEKLQPGKYQPRTQMDDKLISELAESIKAQGLIQPIIVRPIANDRYEIIAGERRWRAAQMAGLTEAPVRIRDVDDNSALAMALIENIQREDLNPLEEARGIKRLVDEFSMTHEQVAKVLGKSRSAVSNLQRLLGLSPLVQEMLSSGQLDMGHARALISVDVARQANLARKIISLGLSVREAEALVGGLDLSPKTKGVSGRQSVDRDTINLQETLAQGLGMAVTISHSKKTGGGAVTLKYKTLDQLDQIVKKLKR